MLGHVGRQSGLQLPPALTAITGRSSRHGHGIVAMQSPSRDAHDGVALFTGAERRQELTSTAAALGADDAATEDGCTSTTTAHTSTGTIITPGPAVPQKSPHSTVEFAVDPYTSRWSPFDNTSHMKDKRGDRRTSDWQAATQRAAKATAEQRHADSYQCQSARHALAKKAAAGSGVALVFAAVPGSAESLSHAEWRASRAEHEATMRSAVSEQRHELLHPSTQALAARAPRKGPHYWQTREQPATTVPGKRTSVWHMRDGSPAWPSQERWRSTQPTQPRIQKNATSSDFKLG